eukprot:CAMPEP_0113564802 /NCGR_PEP_ID=MMETSP0015_2-20120614/21824_1 /TAXON_ID=2838 /ORGANISM="Odontella" /LENGTH=41 /DNA_ID=CAMNT_0000466929 /DNA_START=83 /DNA_END=208 /DNA_ORIENTATION=+ /assembly_acc=CAM_ASM_000160
MALRDFPQTHLAQSSFGVANIRADGNPLHPDWFSASMLGDI